MEEVYQVIELDVSAARTNRDMEDDGLDYTKFKHITSITIASSPIDSIDVKLNATTNDAIPMSEGDKIVKHKIDKIYYTSTSTSATKVKVYIGGLAVR